MDINGKQISKQVRDQIKETVSQLTGRKPCLAVILVGNNPASEIYVKRKVKACQEAGMTSILRNLPENTAQSTLIQEIENLNNDNSIDGILVQLPLPSSINPDIIAQTIHPEKDVDGFHPVNVGKLLIGATDGFVPCTPLGIQEILFRTGINPEGKNVVIIGRSNIVGKPMAALLVQNTTKGNATVTIVHSRTKNLENITLEADIIIVAIGSPKFLTASMVKKGAVVIDVGINREGEKSIVGDADYHSLKDHCSYITPVPGGVGPMTIAMLLQNTLKSFQQRAYTQTTSRFGSLTRRHHDFEPGEDAAEAVQPE